MQRPTSLRTWLRSSKSRRERRARVPGVALCTSLTLCAGLGGSGCGKSTPAPAPTPAPTRASVRLDALVQAQPFAAELRRLPVAAPVSLAVASSPAPLSAISLTQTVSWEQAQERRLTGREAAKRADNQGILDFSERLYDRQQRFLEISKSQFEAQERLAIAGKAAEDRLEAQRMVTDQLAALKDDISLAQTQYQISRALASPANDTLLAPDEPEKVAAEVKRLKAANLKAQIQVDPLTGVRRARVLWINGLPPRNPRVLYAASRDALADLCQELEDRLTLSETQAEAKRIENASEREKEISQHVAQRLEGLRSRDETFVLRLDQEESLSRVLLAEELPTRRAADIPPGQRLPSSKGEALLGKTGSSASKTENDWRKTLEVDVRARVEDVAKRKGIVVSFSPAPGVPDRTSEFANWIKVGL
jgi:hypothetical protein